MTDNEDLEIIEEIDSSDEVSESTENNVETQLPPKSADKYNATYTHFMEWKNSKDIKQVTEDVLLDYFNELAVTRKPPTLWSNFSMLKSTLILYHNLNIGKYKRLTTYLKNKAAGFIPKKAKILTSENVEKFLMEAPDEIHLATKVALIFGIFGALRTKELTYLSTHDVIDKNDIFIIKVPNSRNKIPRTFTIDGEFYKIVKQYTSLRPKKTTTTRFFLNYQRGKCTVQQIGRNKFAAMPKKIATFLNLPDAGLYTGHSFRRTSRSMLYEAGASITAIKRHEGTKLGEEAESDEEDPISDKRDTGNLLTSSIILPSTNPVSTPNRGDISPPPTKKSKSREDNETITYLRLFLPDKKTL